MKVLALLGETTDSDVALPGYQICMRDSTDGTKNKKQISEKCTETNWLTLNLVRIILKTRASGCANAQNRCK